MKNLEPKGLWSSFYSLTQIPRPSGKRKEIADFLVNYGKSLGLETLQDEIGNVLIRKPASAGYENHPGVILQGHMDMVPQKNSDREFDFEKDPIEAYVEDNGEWVTANGDLRCGQRHRRGYGYGYTRGQECRSSSFGGLLHYRRRNRHVRCQ